jgi:signal transduction histidine kinase/CheY-like chemotaxis protein
MEPTSDRTAFWANVRRRFQALVERLTPRQSTEDETDRARFLVQAWVLAGLVWLAYLPLNLASHMWGQLALSVALVVVSAVILLLLWRGVRLALVTHLTLGALTLAFGASALLQRPFDPSNLVALGLVPLMASYLLGGRSAPWVVAAMATAVASYLLGHAGLMVDIEDPHPTASALFNLCFSLLVTWIFTRRFDELRSRSLERMREADRAKNVFLATIGHEIRTPMNGVLGMADVMLAEATSPTQREQLEVIRRSGQAMTALLNDLLDVTRLEAGKLTVDVVPFDLHAVLRDAEALARPLAEKAGLRLMVERAPDVPARVLGDGVRLTQVLNNLLSNAVKFTARGEVRLAASVESHKLVLEVSDTGPGISAEDQQRLFRPFAQLDDGTRRRHTGSGLGLTISKQLVTLMGGELTLDSEPGRGTRLTVRLPLVPAPEPAQVSAPAPTPAPVASPAPGVVLVVDDNPINLRVATALVEKAGFMPVGASSGEEALKLAQAYPVCLVLMDCHMPDMDGFEAAERLRALPGWKATPVVAVTASATPDDVEASRRAGMVELLPKPLRLEPLAEVLRRYAVRAAA